MADAYAAWPAPAHAGRSRPGDRGPGGPGAADQYQPWARLKLQAAHGLPYRSSMYPTAQMIWVAGLVRQSLPALAILDPGNACGIPYAPELGLVAVTIHRLSRMMMLSKQVNCSSP